VNIPRTGYVGVGIIKEAAVRVKDFIIIHEGKHMPILQAPLVASKMAANADDPDLSEYFVRVEWIKAVPKTKEYWKKDLFALQHTACRMTSSFTISKLSEHFKLDD